MLCALTSKVKFFNAKLIFGFIPFLFTQIVTNFWTHFHFYQLCHEVPAYHILKVKIPHVLTHMWKLTNAAVIEVKSRTEANRDWKGWGRGR